MILDAIIVFIIIIIGLGFASYIVKNNEYKKNLCLLWIFHILIAIIFFFYTRNGGGDAWGYWKIANSLDHNSFILSISDSKGTHFMYAFNYIFVHFLNLNYFTNTMLYALFGFIGFSFFYLICLDLIPYNTKYKKIWLFPTLFFLPNLHFWSSGVGKDTLLFMCIAMIAYGMIKIRTRILLIVIGLLLGYLIRPHIALFIILSFGVAYLFNKNTTRAARIILSFVILAAAVVILPTVLEYVKIESITFDNIAQFSDSKAEALAGNSGSAVDISSYPYPLKVLTFLYRPFFFDINGFPALVASFENLLLLILSIIVLRYKPIKVFREAPLVIQALLLFLLLGALTFSASLGNLGIMLRMRNMFLPGMIIYILWSFSYRFDNEESRKDVLIEQEMENE